MHLVQGDLLGEVDAGLGHELVLLGVAVHTINLGRLLHVAQAIINGLFVFERSVGLLLQFEGGEGLGRRLLRLLLIDLGKKDDAVHHLLGHTEHSLLGDGLLVAELVGDVSFGEVVRVGVLLGQFVLIWVPEQRLLVHVDLHDARLVVTDKGGVAHFVSVDALDLDVFVGVLLLLDVQ